MNMPTLVPTEVLTKVSGMSRADLFQLERAGAIRAVTKGYPLGGRFTPSMFTPMQVFACAVVKSMGSSDSKWNRDAVKYLSAMDHATLIEAFQEGRTMLAIGSDGEGFLLDIRPYLRKGMPPALVKRAVEEGGVLMIYRRVEKALKAVVEKSAVS
jgi:hypothetical protein